MELALPSNIISLANKNEQRLGPILKKKGLDWSDFEGNMGLSKFIGEEYISHLFPKDRLKQYFLKAANSLFPYEKSKTTAESTDPDFQKKAELAQTFKNIGIVWFLLRPDMYHAQEEAIELMRKNNYQQLCQEDVIVGQNTYWNMYKDAILKSNADRIMPTRTMVYMHGLCKAMFFLDIDTNRQKEYQEQNGIKDKNYFFSEAQEIFSTKYRGTQGVFTPNTIRGEVVFNQAIRNGYHTLSDPTTAMALDPIYAYRNAVNDNTWTEAPHKNLSSDHKLLQYTGVGIHIPDGNEYTRDLTYLFDVSTLNSIYYSVGN